MKRAAPLRLLCQADVAVSLRKTNIATQLSLQSPSPVSILLSAPALQRLGIQAKRAGMIPALVEAAGNSRTAAEKVFRRKKLPEKCFKRGPEYLDRAFHLPAWVDKGLCRTLTSSCPVRNSGLVVEQVLGDLKARCA